MNYTTTLYLLSAAKECFESGDITPIQYLKVLRDIEHGIVEIDIKATKQSFKEHIIVLANGG